MGSRKTLKISFFFKRLYSRFLSCLLADVYLCRSLSSVRENSIVLFPCSHTTLCCGLAGLVSFKKKHNTDKHVSLQSLKQAIKIIESHGFIFCKDNDLEDHYLGGNQFIDSLKKTTQTLKSDNFFVDFFTNQEICNELENLSSRLLRIIDTENKFLSDHMGRLNPTEADSISQRFENLKDIAWCLSSEISANIPKVKNLINPNRQSPSGNNPLPSPSAIKLFKQINAVLNSIDRLEVRGRDSAGISLLFGLAGSEFKKFKENLDHANLLCLLKQRSESDVLRNNSISIHKPGNETDNHATIAITYKVAAEIGSLGENIDYLRKQIQNDPILQILIEFPVKFNTFSAHTRWASVGPINEANCHPVDNKTLGGPSQNGIIHVCLNGDIDNYLELKKEYEKNEGLIHKDISNDTKIIPLQIEKYIKKGFEIEEAFRSAVNDFEGSHAISMHTDLAPGKLFLAQKGSGQAVFVGIADDHYMPASEVYGFIEQTPFFIKMDGEKIVEGKNGNTQGQIFILDQFSAGGLDGIKALFYDGTPLELGKADIKQTHITSRDIDRQKFPHYFLKEISEAPVSVEKTLQNRWKINEENNQHYAITLDEKVVPKSVQNALTDNQIRRIFFVGQGTAGVAALVCADILNHYMNDPSLTASALKSSELSGFKLNDNDDPESMADTLVIAISQSGTTTDTNRTVDMVKERGAHTLAIVNRRDSDITFKVDGVLYTSSGRDIEMSVASTKAFYSQIVAGALLGLYIARTKKRQNDTFVTEEIKQLLGLPSKMRRVLDLGKQIEISAKKLAPSKIYWAAVGSGPNKASADEIRIKLSELCYKTISSDFVEDKKHIDLSSEPLIVICAAGTRSSVIGDIIKDTAIFRAHKASPVVIADEGERRFDLYAEDVFHVPVVPEHLAPVMNTLAGHLWGYYAALAINEGSRFLYLFREDVQSAIDEYATKGLDVYEVILENSFREKIALFYNEFRKKQAAKQLPATMGIDAATDLILLLKYLSGRLPVSDFELDFGKKGTALNMLNTLFESLGESINSMARPVDAIRHQAKTVTVGTSRITEKVEGILIDALTAHDFNIAQLTNSNVIVLKNLQNIISEIKGVTLYRINGLNLLGEATDETTIEVAKKEGTSLSIPSRVGTDNRLQGTKKIIVRQGNIYIGRGRKDGRSILIIPIISTTPSMPNRIEYLLLLNVGFKENVPLMAKIKALGGKHEHIKNIVQENSIAWDDKFIDLVEIPYLFGMSAEKIGEFIVDRLS